MLLPETDATGASVAAERLLTRLRQTTSPTGTPVTASVGIAFSGDYPNADATFRPRTPRSTRRNRPAVTALWSPPRSDQAAPAV